MSIAEDQAEHAAINANAWRYEDNPIEDGLEMLNAARKVVSE